MLDNPGSRFFTGLLDSTIRQQRHTGTRVLISTQEPTVSTMLISLCSVVIMHRFTSPSWYHTLKQDIHAVKDDDTIIMDIGNLSTGEAIIYAPTALIEIENDGSLKKSTRELIKLNMRDRVTKDGGESLMAI